MDDLWMRVVENMSDRVTGPMKFRFMLQPLMAMLFATIAGLKDAKAGRAPYLWNLVTGQEDRLGLLRDGWKSVGKVFLLALVLDVVFQVMVQGKVYPGETVVVALALAIVPYIIVRGIVTRIA